MIIHELNYVTTTAEKSSKFSSGYNKLDTEITNWLSDIA